MNHAVKARTCKLGKGQIVIPRFITTSWDIGPDDDIERLYFPNGSSEPIPSGALIIIPATKKES